MSKRVAKSFGAFPVVMFRFPLIASVIRTRPWEPAAVHLDAEDDDHRMAEIAGRVGPFVDVSVPFAVDDFEQAKTIRPEVLLVRPVPGRPENQGPRAVSPD